MCWERSCVIYFETLQEHCVDMYFISLRVLQTKKKTPEIKDVEKGPLKATCTTVRPNSKGGGHPPPTIKL